VSDMDPKEARERLEVEKERVARLIQEERTELEEENASEEAETAFDPGDTGTDTFEREKNLGILDDLETELAEIEAAIQRIENGTYGTDEVTGQPIDPERLEAVPYARTNVGTQPRS
jgi:DnaK suppressor protein